VIVVAMISSAITASGPRQNNRVRMPRFFRRVGVTALAVALLAGVTAPTAVAEQDRPELREAVQAFVDAGFAGMQLRVHDQRGEWVGSAGVRKLGETAKPPTNGLFRIGSNTKTFTATVVLQLVAEGKIGLDAPASDYLPQYELDRRITVRMLLQHTSGVFDYTGDSYPNGEYVPGIPWQGKDWVDNRFHTYQPEELVRLALSKPPTFEPGTSWDYSNTNYTLAMLMIEHVTGRSYAGQMQRRILRPLGLRNTVVPGARTQIPGPHAHGYYRYQDAGEWKTIDVTRQNPSWIPAAGDMISTTQDLHTFFSALQRGKLLPAPLLVEMRKPHPATGFGLGVRVQDAGPECGGTFLFHNGSNNGYGALMYSTPDGSRTLTASITTGDAAIDPAAEFPRLLDELFKTAFCG
jgi:D-alanyl-D-alanine carboxypeptidase